MEQEETMSTAQIGDVLSAAESIADSKANAAAKSNISVDSETFLSLLVAQLQYQDPLNAQTDTEFVTQLAQMSSLEEMQEISAGMSSIRAYSLVGKYAYAEVTDADTGTIDCFYGTIDSIVSEGGTYYAVIGENVVKADEITQVLDSAMVDTDTALVETSRLIGKTVAGRYEAGDGTIASVTGTVTGVACEGGVVYAVVDGIYLPADCITHISAAGTDAAAATEI